MAIVQVTVRDEPQYVKEFLASCGAPVSDDLPVEVASSRMEVSKPFTFSFRGTAPLESTTPQQSIVDVLSPETRERKQREAWGCSETSLATLLKVQCVVPTFTSYDSPQWKLFDYPLLEVSFRMLCDGVPTRWLEASYRKVQWAQMLWCRSYNDPPEVGPQKEYGGVFTNKDEEVLYDIPWRVLSATGEGFLSGNGWVVRTNDRRHLAPIRTPIPAIRCKI